VCLLSSDLKLKWVGCRINFADREEIYSLWKTGIKVGRQSGVSMNNGKKKTSLWLLRTPPSSTGTCIVHLSDNYHVEIRFKVKVCPLYDMQT